MITDKIIISKESYHSNNQYEIIYSNIKYIDKLLNNGITSDNISESALKSYYVHLYFTKIKEGGFLLLNKEIEKKVTILYYIRDGLKAIKAVKNANLFKQYIEAKELEERPNYAIFDKLFTYINKSENILELNSHWLKNNKKLTVANKIHLNDNYLDNLHTFKRNQKKFNIEVLKKLCKIANEEYVRITAFDFNNFYGDSCRIKTLNSYFYMKRENNRYVLYDNKTNREVSSILIQETEKNKFFSTFWRKKGY